jgi:hypothetical protein
MTDQATTIADKVLPWARIAAYIGTPVLVGVLGAWATLSAEARSSNTKKLELAVGVLQEMPRDEMRPLRLWAVDVLQKHADLPDEAARLLLEQEALPGRVADAFGRWEASVGDAFGAVSVSPSGVVRAERPGTAVVRFCVGEVCDSATVTVTGAATDTSR